MTCLETRTWRHIKNKYTRVYFWKSEMYSFAFIWPTSRFRCKYLCACVTSGGTTTGKWFFFNGSTRSCSMRFESRQGLVLCGYKYHFICIMNRVVNYAVQTSACCFASLRSYLPIQIKVVWRVSFHCTTQIVHILHIRAVPVRYSNRHGRIASIACQTFYLHL